MGTFDGCIPFLLKGKLKIRHWLAETDETDFFFHGTKCTRVQMSVDDLDAYG